MLSSHSSKLHVAGGVLTPQSDENPDRDEPCHIFQTLTLLLALRVVLTPKIFETLKLRLMLTFRNLPSNSYQKDIVCFAS